PLHCPYCSNPTATRPGGNELNTEEWRRQFFDAADLGALHLGLSGGEPLSRPDLPELTRAAREAGLYTNLITSGLGLNAKRLGELADAGLDSIQISFQADQPGLGDQIAGIQAHERKLEAVRLVKQTEIPLSLNVVLHRGNIDRLPEIIAFAERLGAERLELANTQFYGWAFQNRRQLLPSRQQVTRAIEVAAAATKRLHGRMELVFVIPDYFAERPKPCMHGWGMRMLTVNPHGDVLPCPTASEIKSLTFDNVRQRPLAEIWREGAAFQRFRGTEWMPDPCKSCSFREIDFGGCRCQAALLTGDPAVTDPVCTYSPHHSLLTTALEEAGVAAKESAQSWDVPRLNFRQNPGGRVGEITR
ncbi:MAG TPA: pyrroloquinoline quinone biosynthesis protein PqqE, partial [Chthoniobacteraceae bacterium]